MSVTLWVFEDQLSPDLATLRAFPSAPVLMIESDQAFRAWPYHKKRLTLLISAMRHFRDELRAVGRTVHYYELKAEGYRDSLSALRDHVATTGNRTFHVVTPNDEHTRAWVDTLPTLLGIEVAYDQRTLFLINRAGFAKWARAQRPSPVMETFYRMMRVKHRALMDGAQPVGGRWNFDRENRKPAAGALLMPPVKQAAPDATTTAVMAEVERRFPDHPGSTVGFDYPVTRADAAAALDDFLDRRLPYFGDSEDAMLSDHTLLYHSRLSSAMNAGLLSPLSAIRSAEDRYHRGLAPLNAVEGFVRQILGWREYMYGIYHTYMPEYRTRNARGDDRPLPAFFWTGRTEMNCLRRTIGTVVDRAYSHHIQRLMVICNFATLVGLSPQAVADWFLTMYVDSHDWVVTPNVIGMAMNADGGTCATKPYVSSAAYINRMSDYCQGCRFNPQQRTGDDACPFNYLYWTFLERERDPLSRNPRVAPALKNLDRIDPQELAAMRRQRDGLLRSLTSDER